VVSAIRFANARRLFAIGSVVVLGACAGDVTDVPPVGPSSLANGTLGSGAPAPSDTARGNPSGEWRLATIRGIVIGTDVFSTDTMPSPENTLVGAKVEIHKIGLPPAGGDSTSRRFQDLGVVATVTTDNAGKFEYVLADPLVVKSGQPSPQITYHLTITPPAGSRFAAQSDVQVFFMEQFPASMTAVNYYLFPPRR
jgi:hypothetical protein